MKFKVNQSYKCGKRVFRCIYIVDDNIYGPFVVLKNIRRVDEDDFPLIANYEQDLRRDGEWTECTPYVWVKLRAEDVEELKEEGFAIIAEKPA